LHWWRQLDVDLSRNSFTGQIPGAQGEISVWSDLEYFAAANNQFTVSVPLGFTDSLIFLDVSNNRLTGGIPIDIYAKFPRLGALILGNISLVSGISEMIGDLDMLRYLKLYNCSLTDTIPGSLARLSNIDHVDLQYNNSNSTIPSSIGSLSLFKEGNNNLVGTSPLELGSLVLHHALHVADNSLTGLLPTTLGLLSEL
jgi:Leucine-rich repeat (LRR) protein